MKKTAVVLIILTLMAALTACGNSTPDLQTITIGVLPDVDSIPLIIAEEKGYFKEEGLTVNIEHFKSPIDRDSALQSGKLDGAISDVLAEAFARDNGFDVVITSMTNGSYKLLVNKDTGIKDIKGLKNRDVAISKNTIIEYTTDRMLAEGGLSPEDINKVAIPKIPTRLEMLQNGKIDAATLPEPLATIAINSGAVLLNSSDNLEVNPGVLIFTAEAVEKKNGEIKAIYKAYNRAIEFLKNEPVENYIDILIEKAGLPEAVKGSIKLPEYTKAALPAQKDVEDVITWLYEKKLIKNRYEYKDLVDHQFIR